MKPSRNAVNSRENRLLTARRRARVVKLRVDGKTWEEIAMAIESGINSGNLDAILPRGWDRRYACKDFRREFTRVQKESEVSVDEWRWLNVERLEKIVKLLFGGDVLSPADINSLLATIKEENKMLDLYPREKVDVTSNGQTLESGIDDVRNGLLAKLAKAVASANASPTD